MSHFQSELNDTLQPRSVIATGLTFMICNGYLGRLASSMEHSAVLILFEGPITLYRT